MKAIWLEILLKLRILKRVAATTFRLGADVWPTGRLYAKLIKADGTVIDLGLICTKLMVTTGVNWLAGMQDGTNGTTMKYTGSGTGVSGPTIADTTLGTEVGSRSTGTQSHATNVYTCIGTNSYAGSFAITEAGLFSASTSGTMLDRFVFSAINVVSGDGIQFTSTVTFPTGG
jgi:hypothetical protein